MTALTASQLRVVLGTTFAGVVLLCTTVLHAQDAEIRGRLTGLDLSGVGSLTLSPGGGLVAGLAVLHGDSGPGSRGRIWSVKEQRLVHQFHVPGKAHAVAFAPDSATVVAADRSGNLGWVSTVRAWELS